MVEHNEHGTATSKVVWRQKFIILKDIIRQSVDQTNNDVKRWETEINNKRGDTVALGEDVA